MNATGVLLLLCLAGLVLGGTRRTAMLGLIGTVCYLPLNQQILLGPFHFTGMRTILLAGLFRVLARREYIGLEFTRVDKAVLAYALTSACVACIRVGALSEVVDRAGATYDILIPFFVCRCLLRGYDDMKRVFSAVSYLIVPLAVIMVREARTGNDAFEALGVVANDDIRHGLYRAQGSFQHSITAGIFGATLAPIFIGFSFQAWRRVGLAVGVLASAAITLASASSAPLLAFFLVIFFMACWRFREHMRAFRWGLVAGLVGLELVMKAHVWFIIGRLGWLAGGDAEYRAELIDQALRHFGQWWFIGFHDTGQWMVNTLADGTADITNQYIRIGVDGGLLSVVLFLVVLVRVFSGLGTARRALQSHTAEDDPAKEWLVWCLGCELFVHVLTNMTVTYYDQMRVIWYMLLAMIVGLTSEVLADKANEVSLAEMEGGSPPGSSHSVESAPPPAPQPEGAPSVSSPDPVSL